MPTREITLTEKDVKRFWSKVDVRGPDECWLWLAGCFDGGYGAFCLQHQNYPAPRVAWTIVNGPIPDDLNVCHSCDARYPVGDIAYRRCTNIAHFFLGTTLDNAQDAARKGRTASGIRNGQYLHPETRPRGDKHHARLHPEWMARGDRNGARKHPELHPRGERIGNSKLKPAQVLEIRARYALGNVSQPQLAREYGVHQAAIWAIIHRITWAHI